MKAEPANDGAEADVPAPEDPLEGLTDPKERKLAGLLRLWFGLAQMAGATISRAAVADRRLVRDRHGIRPDDGAHGVD